MFESLKKFAHENKGAVGLGMLIAVVVFAVAGSIMLPVILGVANSTELGLTGTIETIVDNVPVVYGAIVVLGMLLFLASAAE